jgi:hypothetical protein
MLSISITTLHLQKQIEIMIQEDKLKVVLVIAIIFVSSCLVGILTIIF